MGSSGPRVANLQWLLSGHKPNIYRRVKPTYKWNPKQQHGYFGKATMKAVWDYRWRLGMPLKLNGKPVVKKTTVGRDFFEILTGKQKRPIGWIQRAAKRLRAIQPTTTRANLVAAIARSQIGVTEYPDGSNRGRTVSMYQSTTGAYGAAWCVSFAQWVMLRAGVGSFADRTAGVFYAIGWAHRRGYLNAQPRVGAIVAFTNGLGHMGIVIKAGAGWYVTVEGNSSNRVRERFWRMGQRPAVFIYLPGIYHKIPTRTLTAVHGRTTTSDLAPTSVCPVGSSTQLLCLHNYTRRQHGLGLLKRPSIIYRAAGVKADKIVTCGAFTHSPCGLDWRFNFWAVGWTGLTLGENIAVGYPTIRSTYAAWLNSPGHYANIIRPEFDCYGSAFRPTGVMPRLWVVDFARGC